MMISLENRKNQLISTGLSETFLQAIDALKKLGDLQYIIQSPDAAYFYLPQICMAHTCLKGKSITPICDNGPESYYVLLSDENGSHFARVFLETDSTVDFANVDFLMADIFIQLYEFSDSPIEKLIDIADSVGFFPAKKLFTTLENANRSSLELDFAWRKNRLPIVLGP